MAPVKQLDALRASPSSSAHRDHEDGADGLFALDDFEAELERLTAVNQQLLSEFHPRDHHHARAAITAAVELAPARAEELELLRLENAELRERIEQLEAHDAGNAEDRWLERQREYEALLEEKSEVIRGLHQRIHEAQEEQESALGSGGSSSSASCSGTRLGQAEEILRLKREIEDQRRQLEQDEEEMMAQMRQMEIAMAKERAEMARHRQEVQRLQADLAREIEQSSRDPELRERLNTLRRSQEPKVAAAPAPRPTPGADHQKSSGFFRRIFG